MKKNQNSWMINHSTTCKRKRKEKEFEEEDFRKTVLFAEKCDDMTETHNYLRTISELKKM